MFEVFIVYIRDEIVARTWVTPGQISALLPDAILFLSSFATFSEWFLRRDGHRQHRGDGGDGLTLF